MFMRMIGVHAVLVSCLLCQIPNTLEGDLRMLIIHENPLNLRAVGLVRGITTKISDCEVRRTPAGGSQR